MAGAKVKGRKRAPRLPGHLLSNDSFTAPGSSEHGNDRPSSPTSSVETSSILDFDDRLSDVAQSGAKSGFTRITQSPLMNSAIVQGAAPKARVKSTAVGALAPTIKSVLGFGGPVPAASQHPHSKLRASRSQACVPGAVAGMAGLSVQDVRAEAMRVDENASCMPSPQGSSIPHFDKGDLVWYHHPSGPWIPGRFTSRLRSLQHPYSITTERDGVLRCARVQDVVLRTSDTPPRPTAGPDVHMCTYGEKPKHQSTMPTPHAASQSRARGHDRRSDQHRSAQAGSRVLTHGDDYHDLGPESTPDPQNEDGASATYTEAALRADDQENSADVASMLDPLMPAKPDKAIGVGLCITDLCLH
eukprot:jgi/Ulvmu1/5493/UM023_0029.1